MKNVQIIILLATLLPSCVIDGHSDIKTNLINQSNHSIQILPYRNGVVEPISITTIPVNDIMVVSISRGMGKVNPHNYGNDLQLFCDSVKVIYDGVFTVIHRKANDPNLSGIVYTNPRNIINSDNYLRTITSETGYSITAYFDFIFTEQDYLDAKQ
jgi:hypothetical protein